MIIMLEIKIVNNNIDEVAKNSILKMFQNIDDDIDYVSIREVANMDTLIKLLQNENLIHYISYDNDRPIGFAQIIYKSQSINFNTGAKINSISVLPTERHKGVGKTLLTYIIDDLKKRNGIYNLYLDVVQDNVNAIKLYSKLGFIKVGQLDNIFTKNNLIHNIEVYSLKINS